MSKFGPVLSHLKKGKNDTYHTLKSGSKKIRHVKRLTIYKKSTFFVVSSWKLEKLISSWGNHFHQVSWG